MAFAITQTCCNDATCVAVCPVNCIHPTPQERAFGSTEILHIDPKTCIDCGACADACPVDAIFPVPELPSALREYESRNAAYFDNGQPGGGHEAPAGTSSPNFHEWGAPTFDRVLPADFGTLRVAVVGTGPAGMYAAQDLLLNTAAEVTLLDRLPVAGGLVRYGVAPDHPSTKKVDEAFARFRDHDRVRLRLGVEVGKDVTAEEIAAHHDAVVYAVGAYADRQLGIPGEELPGSLAARTLVSWYNAHPDVAADTCAEAVRTTERVVVVGNGNVALDVARILVSDPENLATTDIADHALAALRAGSVREVVLLGRRGPEHAAYTDSELRALTHLSDVDLIVDDHDPRVGATIDAAGDHDKAAVLRDVSREEIDWSARPARDRRRIVLRFHSNAVAALGEDAVDAVRVTAPAAPEGELDVPAGLLLRAVGYRGQPLAGLPFDEDSATVPHDEGRVRGMPGTYVVGWIKRGPSGGIGANRTCAGETIGTLLADAIAGELPKPTGAARAFRRLVQRRSRRVVDARGLAAIHRAELGRGSDQGRPRVKFATVEQLLAASSRTPRLAAGRARRGAESRSY